MKWLDGKETRISAMALSMVLGVIVSPAFTLGTLVRSKVSIVPTAIGATIWGALRWRMVISEGYSHPDHGPVFKALATRMESVVTAAAISDALILTACCFLAGVAGRWIFENHRQALAPTVLAALTGGMIVIGQTAVISTRADLSRAQGIESGSINMIVENRKAIETVIGELAASDREKLLLGYATRLAARKNLDVDEPPMDFGRYVRETADGCAGAETEIAVCDNDILARVRATGLLPEFAEAKPYP